MTFDDVPVPDLQWHFMPLRYSADRQGRPYPRLAMEDIENFAMNSK